MKTVEVFHATAKGNGRKIEQRGWHVSKEGAHAAYYGRGVYFWVLESDARQLGRAWYGSDLEVVCQHISLDETTRIHDREILGVERPDEFSAELRAQGIELLRIERAYFDHDTLEEAAGASLVYLVDLGRHSDMTVLIQNRPPRLHAT